mmetsp:Transcript_30874/g.69596  ORF Transcript_30874/g.69596 Transcript_30874/m.69596 type:complete len:207 (+) Transcript_30874:343-963(+)
MAANVDGAEPLAACLCACASVAVCSCLIAACGVSPLQLLPLCGLRQCPRGLQAPQGGGEQCGEQLVPPSAFRHQCGLAQRGLLHRCRLGGSEHSGREGGAGSGSPCSSCRDCKRGSHGVLVLVGSRLALARLRGFCVLGSRRHPTRQQRVSSGPHGCVCGCWRDRHGGSSGDLAGCSDEGEETGGRQQSEAARSSKHVMVQPTSMR